MKKVIGLTLAAILIAGIAGGGTWAFFSDSETSQNNTLTAGTLDLRVGATDPCTESINLGTQIKPGDNDNAADWTITNLGNISGTLKVEIGSITNYGAYDDLNNYAGIDWESTDGMPTLTGSGELDFVVEYIFPGGSNDNRAQSDSTIFDIIFTLEQV